MVKTERVDLCLIRVALKYSSYQASRLGKIGSYEFSVPSLTTCRVMHVESISSAVNLYSLDS